MQREPFKVKRPGREVVSFSIPPDDLEWLDRQCQREQKTRSEFILQAIRAQRRVGPKEFK